MSRYMRKAAILAAVETTYGTEEVPDAATDAVLFSNVTFNPLNANNVPRDLVRPNFGASEQLVGTAYVEVTFDVEYAGSGTAGTAPAWGKLMVGCGAVEDDQASYVAYAPATDNLQSITLHIHMDGARHKLLGCRGTWELKPGLGERPVFTFRFLGIDGGVAAVSNPSQTLTMWKVPQVVTNPNSGDITLGCTYSAGAIAGGQAYPSRGFPSINCGNDVQYVPLLGGDSIDIVQRESVGSFSLFLTAAQTVTFMDAIKGNELTSIGWLHGTTAGNQVLFYAPKAQRLNYAYDDYNGRAMSNMDLRFTPDVANDEWLIVAL
jgi:hypothetical protein